MEKLVMDRNQAPQPIDILLSPDLQLHPPSLPTLPLEFQALSTEPDGYYAGEEVGFLGTQPKVCAIVFSIC